MITNPKLPTAIEIFNNFIAQISKTYFDSSVIHAYF